MNTAIASKTGQNTGVGFAIPSNVIARVVPELIANGHVIRPDTGITKVYETDKGLLIAAVQTGGPAEQAGLRGFKLTKERKRQGPFVYEATSIDRNAADIITAVNGQPTLTADDFLFGHRPLPSRRRRQYYRPGDGHETQVRGFSDRRFVIVGQYFFCNRGTGLKKDRAGYHCFNYQPIKNIGVRKKGHKQHSALAAHKLAARCRMNLVNPCRINKMAGSSGEVAEWSKAPVC